MHLRYSDSTGVSGLAFRVRMLGLRASGIEVYLIEEIQASMVHFGP